MSVFAALSLCVVVSQMWRGQ